jgi:unsaturated rhamnogalacturonyl hydrolase
MKTIFINRVFLGLVKSVLWLIPVSKLVFIIPGVFLLFVSAAAFAQVKTPAITDFNTPLHALQPDYPVPYGTLKIEQIKSVLDKVYTYLNEVTPMGVIDESTGKELIDFSALNEKSGFVRGDFRLISYEWGVTYAGMLLAGEVTGDKHFTDYTASRLDFISRVVSAYRQQLEKNHDMKTPVRSILDPHALDDAGAMCAAMIKALHMGLGGNLRPMIDTYINYISSKEFRLSDGTLARNRPLPNTLWLDDLFMSVPALSQMGKLTGEKRYFDDAVKQILQFSQRMFDWDKGLFMHGWVQGMEPHPQYLWARANGWAVMTMVELLEVLPENYPGRSDILKILKAHVQGLAACQSGQGFWHQLLDRNDSYLETSATAIYAYSIARAINRGYIDAQAYGPMVMLAWNAISTRVNDKGQVEGTCVGTGMAFDPAFYCYRPVNVFAAHGYGPVLLAGAELIALIKNHRVQINDSALMFDER